MDIQELSPSDNDVTIEGRVKELPTPRAVSTQHGQKRITTAVIQDETGTIDLTLWEEEIDEVEEGEKVIIKGAYAREWGDGIQLNIGRDGEITKA